MIFLLGKGRCVQRGSSGLASTQRLPEDLGRAYAPAAPHLYFFEQLKDPALTGDDAERYRVLERVLRRNFNHLTVYWIIDPADPVAVRVVILGTNRFGVFALETLSIET